MDTRLIYKKSEKLKLKVDWIKPTDTEWIYCGASGEVKWNVVTEELYSFFDEDAFYVATTRTSSFHANKDDLISSIENLVGKKNFIVWNGDFQKAIEFNQIGVFRKGMYSAQTNHPSLKMSYNKMAPGSPDKVSGKLVKYRKGDCLSLACANGMYLAAFISQKFNKYYDLTLIEYLKEKKPALEDFVNGRFFGKYREIEEGSFTPAIEKLMLPCLDIDINPAIEKVGSVQLIELLELTSYDSRKDIADLLQHYQEDIPLRIQRQINYEKWPERLFTSDRLIEMKAILNEHELLTKASQNTGESASAQQTNSI
jgi:hypothetical protein